MTNEILKKYLRQAYRIGYATANDQWKHRVSPHEWQIIPYTDAQIDIALQEITRGEPK